MRSCVTKCAAPNLDELVRRAPACDGVDRDRPDEAELGDRMEGAETRLCNRSTDGSKGVVLLRGVFEFLRTEVADLGVIQVMGNRLQVADFGGPVDPSICIVF